MGILSPIIPIIHISSWLSGNTLSFCHASDFFYIFKKRTLLIHYVGVK